MTGRVLLEVTAHTRVPLVLFISVCSSLSNVSNVEREHSLSKGALIVINVVLCSPTTQYDRCRMYLSLLLLHSLISHSSRRSPRQNVRPSVFLALRVLTRPQRRRLWHRRSRIRYSFPKYVPSSIHHPISQRFSRTHLAHRTLLWLRHGRSLRGL